ncbi:MAG: hypothetical protein RL026_2664 [Pseudomonadota bacterium]|jgi:NAD(P)-dependent dehydrogenase (short-subunit alcohol dehydrogenase family)
MTFILPACLPAAAPDALAGRVVLVTGASDGIGRAVALAAAAHGAEVVLCGRSVRKLEAVHQQVSAACGERSAMAPLDLEKAVARDYDQLADAVMARYGRLDGLVHCAGLLGSLTPLDQYDVPTWCKVLHVNLTATFVLTQVLLPALRASADASVLFTTSGVARHPRAYWGAYAVSKAGVENLAGVLSAELQGSSRIRVNTLNPGPTRTRMRRQAFPSEDLERLPRPEDIASAYVALLAPTARGLDGQRIDCQPSSGAAPSSSASNAASSVASS